MITVITLILAAGRATRMNGIDKLMIPVDGTPQIFRLTQYATNIGTTVITLPHQNHERTNAIIRLPAYKVYLDGENTGMGSSISHGVDYICNSFSPDGIMIVPCDMPELSEETLNTMKNAFNRSPLSILRAKSHSGKMGHPVIFPNQCFHDLCKLTRDEGARSIIKENSNILKTVTFLDESVSLDLDTPEEWRKWSDKK